jgi:hypothetical protein
MGNLQIQFKPPVARADDYHVFAKRQRDQVFFTVKKRPELNWRIGPTPASAKSEWGLWQKDVVEVFFKRLPDDFYYELQVAPNHAFFHLKVLRPREIIASPLDLKWSFTSEIDQERNEWRVQLTLPFDGDIIGNFHACLGDPQTFYSRHLYPGQLDFHRPELFLPL